MTPRSIDELFGKRANIYFSEPTPNKVMEKAKVLGLADNRWLIVVAKKATGEVWLNIDLIERVVPR